MRDPDGEVVFTDNQVIRTVRKNFSGLDFLTDPIAEKLISLGLITNFYFIDKNKIQSSKYPFITYPHEWCNAQLVDAGNLTLEISDTIYRGLYELKDAAAYNVIFIGTSPIFCDLLSFQKITSREWWAFGQFCRNFIFPIYTAKYIKFNCHEVFTLYRDGLSTAKTSTLIGFRRLFSGITPLIFGGIGNNYASNKKSLKTKKAPLHLFLYEYCKWILRKKIVTKSDSVWLNYINSRAHYSPAYLQQKKQSVSEWLKDIKPRWVLDVGCNTGEFSEAAAAAGANVIATDSDHDCIEYLYRKTAYPAKIHPLVFNWSDCIGGKGYLGSEYKSLLDRVSGISDLTMMLAVIHHLIISEGLSEEKIADLAHASGSKYLILETISNMDQMANQMLVQKPNISLELSHEKQLKAFEKYFTLKETVPINQVGRQLHLLIKK